MSRKKLPIVAIVGRANVGKSSLFNAVLKKRESIVADEPGTTRDSVYSKVTTESGNNYWLIDSAGLKDPEDDFEFTIQEQILQATESADLILVMVEANVMVTEEDRKVAKMALKSKKSVVLIVNKIDKAKDKDLDQFKKLGIKKTLFTSITHKKGLVDVINYINQSLPTKIEKEDENRIKIALLGRPNVGKSALFNTLAKKQQAIVSDRAGTTRDVNRSIIRYKKHEIELLDTAGIRRSGKIEKGVEKFSVLRSLSAIEEADVCLLLVDAKETHVQLDQKIAGMIKDSGKGLILAVSKWDSIKSENSEEEVDPEDINEPVKTPYTRDAMAKSISHDFDFVPWAPLIFTSSVTGQNVAKILELVLEIMSERSKKIKTPEANRWLKSVLESHPPAGLKNRNPKLNYITQEIDNKTPSFKVFGSHTKYLHWSYKRFMDRKIREKYGFHGTPVQFWFIEKNGK